MEHGKILPKQEKPVEPKDEPVPIEPEPTVEGEKGEEVKTAKDVLQPANDKAGTDLAHSANTKE